MQADKYKSYTATDFLKDKDFLRWQLFNGEEDMLFWGRVIEEYPALRSRVEEGIVLYKDNIRFNDFKMSRPEISESCVSLQNLIGKKKKQNTRRVILSISAIAASIDIFIFSLHFIFNKDNNEIDLATFVQTLSADIELLSTYTYLHI